MINHRCKAQRCKELNDRRVPPSPPRQTIIYLREPVQAIEVVLCHSKKDTWRTSSRKALAVSDRQMVIRQKVQK